MKTKIIRLFKALNKLFIKLTKTYTHMHTHTPQTTKYVRKHVQFSHSVMSDSLQSHGLHNARPPCPSPTPGVPLDSCPSSQWCHIGLYNLLLTLDLYRGFPGGASGKEPACQCWRHKRCGFDPWVAKILWRRAWQPTPVFLPAESHGQRNLAGYSPWGSKKSDMTEVTQ